MWFWSTIALAAPTGYWHPDDLAPLSERYKATSEALQVPFGQRADALEQVARALREYREGLDLLGSRAPEGERARLESLELQFQRESAQLQAFADVLVEDYDHEFRSAIERATARVGEVAECASTVRKGPALPGVPGRSEPNLACQGRNLNADLAKAVDADGSLRASLEALLARPWPEVTVSASPQAPVGGAERWLSLRALLAKGAPEPLRQIDRQDDQARDEIEAAIESGASLEELKKLEPRAKAIEAETAAARAALAAPIVAAAEARMAKKWTGEPATGWCANPVLLGGCTGDDQSAALVERLTADPKVAKALRAAQTSPTR